MLHLVTDKQYVKKKDPTKRWWCKSHASDGKGVTWSTRFQRFFMSRYELAVASFLDFHGVKFAYEPYEILLDTTFWLPDLYIERTRTFLEIKGRFLGNSKEKISEVANRYPSLRFYVIPFILERQFVRFCEKNGLEDF